MLEQGQGLALAGLEQLVEPFGDADGLVVVADLGLVVPEHRQPAVAAEAVQPQLEDFAAAATGDDDRLPGVAQAPVVRVVASASRRRLASSASARATSSGNGDRVAADDPSRRGHGGDESPAQADPFGVAGLQGLAEQTADAVEDGLPGVGGNDGRLAMTTPESQRHQAVPLPVALVGDELLHVLRGQCPGVVPASGSVDFQEGAQLQTGSAHVVEGAGAARAVR